MQQILVVETSPQRSNAFSNQLSKTILAHLWAKYPGAQIQTRDLVANPPPPLTTLDFGAYSDQAIAELLSADAIVLNVPTHNFSIPSVLKAWVDQVARAGKTFSYSSAGPEGLVKGKKVYLAIASGGVHTDGKPQIADFTEPYLKAILGFLGMTDVTTFRVEGLAIPGIKETALEKAIDRVSAHAF